MSGKATAEVKKEDVTQALVLADSFDQRFMPITLDIPRCLMPIANLCLLDYTMELLVASGIVDIIVFCCAHADLVLAHVKRISTRYGSRARVSTMVSKACASVGEALREVFLSERITGDFVLISGDVVSNMRLDRVVQEHKARRRDRDRHAAMTMVLKKATPTHRSKSVEDDTIVAVDPATSKLLYFDVTPEKKKIDVEIAAVFPSHPVVQFRHDLLDCRIDICSVEVLSLFADNFDWQDLRQDCIKGILTEELLNSSIYTHVISGEYAARVRDLRTYNSVSMDVIHRWTYPLVLDNNFLGTTAYVYRRPSVYVEERSVRLARSAVVGPAAAVARGTEIGEASLVSRSVVGRNCKIGANVRIEGSYVWDEVVIEDNAHIVNSVVCTGARIGRNTHVAANSLICCRVFVNPDLQVPPGSRLTTHDGSSLAAKAAAAAASGATAAAGSTTSAAAAASHAQPAAGMSSEDLAAAPATELFCGGPARRWLATIEPWNSLVPTAAALAAAAEEEAADSDISWSDDEDDGSGSGSEGGGDHEVFSEEDKFLREVQDTMRRAIQENHDLDNTHMEISGLKFAYNKDLSDCLASLVPVLLESVDLTSERDAVVSANFKKMFTKWKPMLKKFSRSPNDQLEVVLAMQEFADAPERPVVERIFSSILYALYDQEIVSEDAIWKWADQQKQAAGIGKRLLQSCEKFLKWLKEAEEEDDDDDDDDE